MHAPLSGGVMPQRCPRPFPSTRSMKVVWSCSSFSPTARRTRHSAIAAMPFGVARTYLRRHARVAGCRTSGHA